LPTRHKKNWGAGGLQMPQPASAFLSRGQERRPQIPTFLMAGTLVAIKPVCRTLIRCLSGKFF